METDHNMNNPPIPIIKKETPIKVIINQPSEEEHLNIDVLTIIVHIPIVDTTQTFELAP